MSTQFQISDRTLLCSPSERLPSQGGFDRREILSYHLTVTCHVNGELIIAKQRPLRTILGTHVEHVGAPCKMENALGTRPIE
jgi:hypothetical protein